MIKLGSAGQLRLLQILNSYSKGRRRVEGACPGCGIPWLWCPGLTGNTIRFRAGNRGGPVGGM